LLLFGIPEKLDSNTCTLIYQVVQISTPIYLTATALEDILNPSWKGMLNLLLCGTNSDAVWEPEPWGFNGELNNGVILEMSYDAIAAAFKIGPAIASFRASILKKVLVVLINVWLLRENFLKAREV
jgi:hypothetical protein